MKRGSLEVTVKAEAIKHAGAPARLSTAFGLLASKHANLKSFTLEVFAVEVCLEIAEG
ncbi:hypothetical protein [Delftia tsuruhatensis]|uniref:hypothetical protein n=1 Tax=Delftia tsuruhatensis TaxID=180282 RepID=UPI00209091F7|nr:hypothetical protein [Delftia tsuruhatensis]MCO5339309.1 hypothetical protein [Delftia tsuruhatensis]MCR4546924.1 hypothetical protein [Delftia tsuruhatensis]